MSYLWSGLPAGLRRIPAPRADSQQGELSAVCGALLWLLSLPAHPVLQIFSDSLPTAWRATGRCNCPEEDSLSLVRRSLFQASEAAHKISADSVSHVYSHQGCHWNELADCLAKFGVTSGYATGSVNSPLGSWIHDCTVQHLWLLVPARHDPQAWPLHVGDGIVDPGCLHDWDFLFFPAGPTPASVPVCHHIRLLSVSVQTLGDDSGDPELASFGGRTALLRTQLARMDVNIAGLQETRSARADCVVPDSFDSCLLKAFLLWPFRGGGLVFSQHRKSRLAHF